MAKILVSGLINIETTLTVESFPIAYSPVRYPFFGVKSTVSGVGWNISKALAALNDQPVLLSMLGNDFLGNVVLDEIKQYSIDPKYLLRNLINTPQSVILFDSSGRRQINVDLKDVQNKTYPDEHFAEALTGSDLAVMCNINFSRSHLEMVKKAGILLATDVHTISSLDDPYNQDFMKAADILFCSDELLPCKPEEWARQVFNRYRASILVIGMGNNGALLSVRDDGFLERLPSISTRPVVNTIGAGDALFSSFLHYFLATGDAMLALQKAMVFASYKIGESGAAEGFLSETGLDDLYLQITSNQRER